MHRPQSRCTLITLILVVTSLLLPSRLLAQCTPQWIQSSPYPGLYNRTEPGTADLNALCMWDPDGAGPRQPLVVLGGLFLVSGTELSHHIVAFDPQTNAWSSFGSGMSNSVLSLVAMPNGDLVAGGSFTSAGGTSASRIARWNGSTWSPLGAGLNQNVEALVVMPNGDLVAGGRFTASGAVSARTLARWNGSTWSQLGGGTNLEVRALALMPNGDLYFGGQFATLDGSNILGLGRWDGFSYSAVGGGISSGSVNALAVHPDGSLLVGGILSTVGGVGGLQASGIARWDGSAWSNFGIGTDGGARIVFSVSVQSDGSIVVGGNFTAAGGQPAPWIARWNGNAWGPVGSLDAIVHCTLPLSDGSLIAGGSFLNADGAEVNHVARWNGNSWSRLSLGFDARIKAVATLTDGSTVAAGDFQLTPSSSTASRIARFDGQTWLPLSSGLNASPEALLSLADGSFVVGGAFTSAGGVTANSIARWNGSTFVPYSTGMNAKVNALALLSNGDLAAGGMFSTAGGISASRVARWNGLTWAPFGSGIGYNINALAVLKNGDLVVGGDGLNRWDGTAWRNFGSGVHTTASNNAIYALAVSPSGDLYIGGNFSGVDTLTTPNIARWNGTTWSALGPGLPNGIVHTLTMSPDGDLFAGGLLVSTTPNIGRNTARWNGVSWQLLDFGIVVGDPGDFVTSFAFMPNGDLAVGSGEFTTPTIASPFLSRYRTVIRPRSVSTDLGATATFNARADGNGAPAYQWLRHVANSWIPLSDTPGKYAGTATESLTVFNVAAPDISSYSCLITNNCGTAPSAPASLTLNGCGEQLINPDFESSNLAGWSVSGTAPTIQTAAGVPHALSHACVRISAPSSVLSQSIASPNPFHTGAKCWARRAVAGQTAWLQLTASSSGSGVSLNSWFDLSDDWREYTIDCSTLPANTTLDSLQIRALDASSNGYDIFVDDVSFGHSSTTSFTQSPADTIVCAHHAFTLTTQATGGTPLTYAWLHDGNLIPGAASSSYTVNDALASDAGIYICIASSPCGTIHSAPATVTTIPTSDFNQSGGIDFFDYLDFVDAYSLGDPSADFNHDASIDFFDYLDFVDAFSAGC